MPWLDLWHFPGLLQAMVLILFSLSWIFLCVYVVVVGLKGSRGQSVAGGPGAGVKVAVSCLPWVLGTRFWSRLLSCLSRTPPPFSDL